MTLAIDTIKRMEEVVKDHVKGCSCHICIHLRNIQMGDIYG